MNVTGVYTAILRNICKSSQKDLICILEHPPVEDIPHMWIILVYEFNCSPCLPNLKLGRTFSLEDSAIFLEDTAESKTYLKKKKSRN